MAEQKVTYKEPKSYFNDAMKKADKEYDKKQKEKQKQQPPKQKKK